jgi:dihydroneopterin triphosphate diphosphatase
VLQAGCIMPLPRSTPASEVRLFDCFVVRQREDPEFLLLRRAAGKIYEGSWRMVGGKLEAGEKAFEACLRELHEETGLVPLRLWAVPYVNRFYEWQRDQVHDIPVFLAECAPNAQVVLDDEHDAATWVGQDEALKLLEWPCQREGLTAAAALRKGEERLGLALEIPLLSLATN